MTVLLPVCTTPQARARLHTTLSVTSLLGIAVSCLFLAALLYSLARHSFLLRDLLLSLLDLLFVDLILRGVLLLILSLICWKINRNIALEPLNPSLNRSVQVWSTLTLLCCVSAVLWVISEPGVTVPLQEAVSQRYKLAVKRYLESDVWRQAVDRVHNYVGCCGIDNHTDWYSITWIPLSRLPGDPASYSKEVEPSGRVLVPLVPSSCCRVLGPDCGHLAWLQANRSWAGLRPVDPGLLHDAGCASAVARIFAVDLMLCRTLLLAVATLQVVMLVCLRYLWSATYNALLLGRPGVSGVAPAWLASVFGTGALQIYHKNCGDTIDQNIDSHDDKKHRWRCIDKFRGRGVKEADNDGVLKSKNDRSISPCIEKLMKKVRGTHKPRQNEDSKSNLNVKTEYDQRDDGDSLDSLDGTPRRFAQAKNKLSSNNISFEENESLPLLTKPQNVRVFEMAASQKSPFIGALGKGNKSPPQNLGKNKHFKNLEVVKPTRVNPNLGLNSNSYDTESEKDFQKTRSLFEKVAKRVSLRTFYGQNQALKKPANVIQFEKSPRSKTQDQESDVLLNESYSPRSEPNSIPLVLRNYRIPPNV